MKIYKETKIVKRKNKKLVSTIKFCLKIAQQLSKPEYYMAYGDEIVNLPKRDKEKVKVSTGRQSRVTDMITQHKTLLKEKGQGYFYLIKGIYETNKREAYLNKPPPIHSNLMNIVASVPNLIISYARIRKNKGASTLGAMLSFDKLKTLNPSQRRYLSQTGRAPDGLTMKIFKATSWLLKNGQYPWGASRRIYIDKPGRPAEKRPITIPPFMDRVIQASILRVLEAIYEPWFEKRNRSFGFRPNKGVHDAIYSIIRQENKGLYMAIEGDIKGAYDNVKKRKLLLLLEKRIKDKKFLEMIKHRLDYIYYDAKSDIHVEENELGIPQGGIDSPYLWNIYCSELDEWIHSYMDKLCNELNEKVLNSSSTRSQYDLKKKRVRSKETNLFRAEQAKIMRLKQVLSTLHKPGDWENLHKNTITSIKKGCQELGFEITKGQVPSKELKFALLKAIKKVKRNLLSTPAINKNRQFLRYHFCRYADDWILLGNFSQLLAEKIRTEISTWLDTELAAKLVIDKTKITDMRKEPAHFLGFELRTDSAKKLKYVRNTAPQADKRTKVLKRVAGTEITACPDRQRLISRYHMKGYCNKKGIPKALGWLSSLENFAIISRYNAVLKGTVNYYGGFIKYNGLMARWLYILRFSCLKTLCCKYKTRISKLYNRFGINTKTGKTVMIKVSNTFSNEGVERVYEKKWTLCTYLDLIHNPTFQQRFEKVKKTFNRIEYGKELPAYENISKSVPAITDMNFLEKIHWVNLRTQASFDLCYSLCGDSNNVEMHHIKHVRKTPYNLVPEKLPWLKAMILRNRKQIPVCRHCHMEKIHKGTYHGANLKAISPIIKENEKGYDLRLMNIESYIKPGPEYFVKSLEEKGWILKQTKILKR
jgi:retron-type reverse transcriptase